MFSADNKSKLKCCVARSNEGAWKQYFQRWLPPILLGVIGLTHWILAKLWVGQNFFLRFNNSHANLTALSAAYRDIVYEGKGFSSLVFRNLGHGLGDYRPALIPKIYLFAMFLAPHQGILLVNFFYLIVIMSGIYCATKFLIGDRYYSLLAASVFSCYPLAWMQLVSCEALLAVWASVIWGFYWYLRSEFFTRFWPTVGVGLFLILAFYSDRWSGGFFLSMVLFIPENFRHKKSWLHMAGMLVVVLACIWPFYYQWIRALDWSDGLVDFFDIAGDHIGVLESYQLVLWDFEKLQAHLLYYFVSLPDMLLGYGFTALFAIGLWQLRRHRSFLIFVVMLSLPAAFFVVCIKKHYLFIMPLYLWFAMVTVMGIFFIRHQGWRRWVVALLIVLSALHLGHIFVPQGVLGKILFSNNFEAMHARRIPKLFSWDCFGTADKQKLESIMTGVSPFLGTMPRTKATLMVDLKEHVLHHTVVFLLQTRWKDGKVLNVGFEDHVDPRDWAPVIQGYLVSDRGQYEAGRVQGSVGGCPYAGLEPIGRFFHDEVVLYKIKRAES
ncbi:MAG: hypothetical protein V1882_09945 [Candidatus Omnitrophota bacterium]